MTQWFASYYRPGTVTTGFDTYLRKAEFGPDNRNARLELDITRPGKTTLLLVLEGQGPWKAEASVPVEVNRRLSGCLELTLDADEAGAVHCTVTPC